jgi:hypothetical protein
MKSLSPAAAPPPPAAKSDPGARKLVVGREIVVSGEIASCEGLVVEGTVRASVECKDLQIASSGLFTGSASVANAEIFGRFEGELTVELRPDRPTIVANFVSTIDGAVALGPGEPNAGGGEISGFSEADRFMMSLLRALADVVIVGAGTVRAGRHRHAVSQS